MKKSLRNLMIGAVMTAGVFAASASALAATKYVTNDMNFRGGASSTATLIGSVPAGAQVEVLDLQNGWNLIRYNGMTGYIHGGNLADTYVAAPKYNTTQSYFDNNWTGTAANMNATSNGAWKTVHVDSGYLAFRTTPAYDASNEIGQLHNGDTVQLIGGAEGSYVRAYSPKFGTHGWVNAGFLK